MSYGRATIWGACSCAAIPGPCAEIHRRSWPRRCRRRHAMAGTPPTSRTSSCVPTARTQRSWIPSAAPAPSPPLVASPDVDAEARERLTRVLIEAHRAADARPLLDNLLLTRFDRVIPAD